MKEVLPNSELYASLSSLEKNVHLKGLYRQIPLSTMLKQPLEEIRNREGKTDLELLNSTIRDLLTLEHRGNSESSRILLADLRSLLKFSQATPIFQEIVIGDFRNALIFGRGANKEYEKEINQILDGEGSQGIFNKERALEIEGTMLAQALKELGIDSTYMIAGTLNWFSMRWWVKLYWRRYHKDPREFLISYH